MALLKLIRTEDDVLLDYIMIKVEQYSYDSSDDDQYQESIVITSWLKDSWKDTKHVLEDVYLREGCKIDLTVMMSTYLSKWDVLLIKCMKFDKNSCFLVNDNDLSRC